MPQRMCPVCHAALAAETHHGISVDVCQACAGMWFDAGEIEQLRNTDATALLQVESQHAPDPRRHPVGEIDRWCPACPQPLERYYYSPTIRVIIDLCTRCRGMWVDHGELCQIDDAIRRTMAPPRFDVQSQQRLADAEVEMARFALEHDRFMARQRALTTLFGALSRDPRWRRSWWW